MIKTIFICLFFPLWADLAVTYESSVGIGFGDQMIGYVHAKWIAYRYGPRVLYKPFLYSDQFALHDLEEPWSLEKEKAFPHIVGWINDRSFLPMCENGILYFVPFFSDLPEDRQYFPTWSSLNIDWEDVGFREILRAAFAPRKDRYLPSFIPRDLNSITVAMHVRKGGRNDIPTSIVHWPLRFPSDRYYIDCLKQLVTLFPGQHLEVRIFTDDLHPERIAADYQRQVDGLPISFSYEQRKDGPEALVLDDFFGMMHFDCLIRSASNYSLIPSLIGDYKVVMTPQHGYWPPGGHEPFHVDKIDVQIRR